MAGLPVVELRVQPHVAEHLLRPAADLCGGVLAKNAQGFLHDPPDGEGGVQGGVGVLKDHLGPPGVVDDLPLVLGHAQDGLGQGGLAAAGLPHQAQNLPLAQGDVDVFQHLDGALLGEGAPALVVKAVEISDLQDGFHGPYPRFRLVGMAAMRPLV